MDILYSLCIHNKNFKKRKAYFLPKPRNFKDLVQPTYKEMIFEK